MAKATTANVNKALKAIGINAEIVKGYGQWYFAGDDIDVGVENAVCVTYVSHLSIDEWVLEAQSMLNKDHPAYKK